MIYLELLWVFLKIGALSFGGGYGMISLVREEVLLRGWMDEERFLDFIAVAESTPVPWRSTWLLLWAPPVQAFSGRCLLPSG